MRLLANSTTGYEVPRTRVSMSPKTLSAASETWLSVSGSLSTAVRGCPSSSRPGSSAPSHSQARGWMRHWPQLGERTGSLLRQPAAYRALPGSLRNHLGASLLRSSLKDLVIRSLYDRSNRVPLSRRSGTGDRNGGHGHGEITFSSASRVPNSSTHSACVPPPGSSTPASLRHRASPRTVRMCQAMTRATSTGMPENSA